jgi:hypothetical protein
MSKAKTVLNTKTEELPVRLSPDELRDRGERLAFIERQLVDHKVAAKAQKGALKQKETELLAEIDKLSTHIHAKEEPRQVVIEVRPTGKGEVEDVRTDTGEVVRRRTPSDSERQPEMFPVGDA